MPGTRNSDVAAPALRAGSSRTGRAVYRSPGGSPASPRRGGAASREAVGDGSYRYVTGAPATGPCYDHHLIRPAAKPPARVARRTRSTTDAWRATSAQLEEPASGSRLTQTWARGRSRVMPPQATRSDLGSRRPRNSTPCAHPIRDAAPRYVPDGVSAQPAPANLSPGGPRATSSSVGRRALPGASQRVPPAAARY